MPYVAGKKYPYTAKGKAAAKKAAAKKKPKNKKGRQALFIYVLPKENISD